MISLQNARSSRNRILVMRCAVIILLCGALPTISAISTSRVCAQAQLPTGKFRRIKNPIPYQYIVVLDDDTLTAQVPSVASEMVRMHGGNVTHLYRYALKGFSVSQMLEAEALAISLDPRVEFVEENGFGLVATTQTNPPWGLDRIDQRNLPLDNAYSYTEDGNGVTAYVLDTGIRTGHTEFGGRASFGADCVDGGADCSGGTGQDCTTFVPDGHGTSVAGIIGGTTFGLAKNVTLKTVRVCGCNQMCATDKTIAGVDWVTANHADRAIANMSLVLRVGTALDKAVRKSVAAGVTYTVSAGNGNEDAGNVTPARVTQAITVGATDISDHRASFSNFGTALDLFAPGVDTPSASAASDTATTLFGGTSAASPHAGGAVARYLQTDQLACPSTVSDVLSSNATSGVVVDPGTGSPNLLLFAPLSWATPTYYSLSLNGSNAYVDVPNTPAGTGVSIDITGPVTVEAWIKLNDNTARQAIVERYNPLAGAGTSDGGYGLRLMPSGTVRFFTFKNSVEYSSVTGSTALQTGIWYHVAGVFDGSQLRIFVQGNNDATPVSVGYSNQGGTSNLKIGVSPEGAYFFNGLIDEARVTAWAVYAASFTPQHKLTGLVDTKGLWRFDRQNAKDCADINNGTLVGGFTFSTSVP